MLLAVAGLNTKQIAERTKQLADGDWSRLPLPERTGFLYARQMTEKPWSVTDLDFAKLVQVFGKPRAVDVVWWASRCHYMTRVADAFQLPLEKENVFK
ncbi:MAG: hypothetical protein ACRCZF_27515 [Gemmataceae bacterium]